MPILEKKDVLRKMIKGLHDINYVVKVGVQGPEASTKHSSSQGSHLTIVELAAIHEFGAPSANIPQRAFIRSLADSEREIWAKELEEQLKRVVNKVEDGHAKGDAKAALTIVGEKYRTAVIKRMQSGIPPPNAEVTVERKGSDTPLIDTGALLRSITSVVSPPPRGSEQ